MWQTKNIVESRVQGCVQVFQATLGDSRGWFSRVLETGESETFSIEPVVAVNNSWSRDAGTLRGLHWQARPYSEGKIVRCIRGSVLDIIVDVRAESPTFGSKATFRLESHEPSFVVVPKGCAHGILTLEDDTEIIYFTDHIYVPDAERGMRFDDPFAHLVLPLRPQQVSEKDLTWPDFQPKLPNAKG